MTFRDRLFRLLTAGRAAAGFEGRAAFLAGTVILLTLTRGARAATLTVGPGQTYGTIGAAVTAAASGDTIDVMPGTYNEHLVLAKSLTIQGDASQTYLNPVVVDGSSTGVVFTINTGQTITLSGLVIQHGKGTSSSSGSGIKNTGTLTLNNSTVQNNMPNVAGSNGTTGTGLTNSSFATVTNCAFINNQGSFAAGINNVSVHGMTITNTTFSGNAATGTTTSSGDGGALENNASNSTVALVNCTVVGNSSKRLTAIVAYAGTITLKNSLIANNTGGNCGTFFGTFTSLGHNLSTDATCGGGAGDQTSVADPKIGALQSNGGLTSAYGLLSGSPAIDQGDNTGAPAADQRGIARPFNSTVDIGSFEFVSDADSPSCGYTFGVNGSGLKFVQVTYQDTDTADGINTLQLVSSTNDTQKLQIGSGAAAAIANSTYGVPFANRNDPVVLTSTKTDQSMDATDAVIVTDLAGGHADCTAPLFTSILVQQPGIYQRTFSGVSIRHGQVHLLNGDPGIDHLDVLANGRLFSIAGLASGEQADLNVSPALSGDGSNVVTLRGYGSARSQAFVLMGAGTLERATASGPPSTPGPIGDVNGDGRVDVADAIDLLEAVVSGRTLTDREAQAIGSMANARATVADVVALLRKVAGE